MSTLRTSRIRLAGAAATVVVAALSLSACSDGTGLHTEPRPAATSAGHSTASPSAGSRADSSSLSSNTAAPSNGSASSKGSAHSNGSSLSKTSVSSKAPVSTGTPVTCEGSNTRTVAAPLNRPVNHMLLTVTNTGSKSCYLYGYPSVSFGEAQSVPPVIEESKPQAVVTLQPGESGYASVSLSATDGSGSNGHTAKTLTVYFQGRSGSGSTGPAAHPALPAKGAYVDDSLKVSYWQQSMDDAVSW
ncbi:DUF4232 domain-containing protein [Streptomyces sp. NPDC001544]|uniref:DUF4232 domain-containing protein n=1 Tax=Streptomyces sp. NPDC001544 TaxID=3364584 RepID=UPI0036A7478C